jgi:hypothetical protein
MLHAIAALMVAFMRGLRCHVHGTSVRGGLLGAAHLLRDHLARHGIAYPAAQRQQGDHQQEQPSVHG